MKRFWSISFLLLLIFPWLVRAESHTVIISEVSWAGSSASNADEWFELFNSTDSDIDLSGWAVTGAGTSGSELVFPDGSVISASGTFIVSNYDVGNERTILEVEPQWVTTSVSLSNSALLMTLVNADGNSVDVSGDGSSPLAGNSGDDKKTMERVFPTSTGSEAESWVSSETEAGTPGAILVSETDAPADEPVEPEPASGGGVVVDPIKTYLRISELYPSPNSGEKEWLELENISSIGEFLEGWVVEDSSGEATPLNGLILPWAKAVVMSPKGKLNNSGDTIFLKDPKGRVIDAVTYGKSVLAGFPHGAAPKRGQSLMREELRNAYLVTTTPTRGEKNVYTDPNPSKTEPVSADVPKKKSSSAKTILIPKLPADRAVPNTIPVKNVLRTVPVVQSQTLQGGDKADDGNKKRTSSMAKKKATRRPRYKGLSYTATVAVPPGVYSKARMLTMIDDTIRELRLTKSPNDTFEIGEMIRFIAQEKNDGDASYLRANIKTLYKTGRKKTISFTETKQWPDTAGPYELTGTVKEANGKLIRVLADGQTGVVESPVSYKESGLQAGDVIAVKGYYERGEFPRMVMLDAKALRVLQPIEPVKSTGDGRKRGMPLPIAVALSAGILGSGLMVYLRQERLKRVGVSNQKPPAV